MSDHGDEGCGPTLFLLAAATIIAIGISTCFLGCTAIETVIVP